MFHQASLFCKEQFGEVDLFSQTRNAIRLNNSLKNFTTLCDKSELVSKLRVIKSTEEIKYVRKAAELSR